MIDNLMDQPLTKRFEHLLTTFQSERFLAMAGLANEVPFFICPYHPQEANEMTKTIHNLIAQLKHKNIKVLEINLYDLCLEIIKQNNHWEMVLGFEKENSKDEMLEMLQGMLDTRDFLIPEIEKKMKKDEYNIIFLTGIGEVYPYIRSHVLLNHLQSVIKDKPLVMFYPGNYMETGKNSTSLILFERLSGNPYYRARNILTY